MSEVSAKVTLPDGRSATVTGPTRDAVLQRVEALRGAQQSAQPQQPLSGIPAGGAFGIPTDPEAQRGLAQGFEPIGQGLRQQAQGAQQGLLQLAEVTGINDPEVLAGFTQDAIQQRKAWKTQFLKKNPGLTEEQVEAAITTGEFLPGLAVPSLRAGSISAAVFKNSLLGSGFAGAQFVTDPADRLGNVALGATLGGLIGVAAGVKPSIQNTVFKRARELSDDPTVLARRAEADAAGLELTLGQASGDPLFIGMEAAATGPTKQKFFFRQAEQLRDNFLEKVTKLQKAGDIPRRAAAKTIQNSLQATKSQLSRLRNAGWNTGLRRLEEVSGATPLVQPRKLLNAVDDLIEAADNVSANPTGNTLPNQFRVYRANLATMVERGGATAGEINQLLVGLNSLAKGGGKIFKEGAEATNEALAAGLRSGLFDDVADSIAAGRQAIAQGAPEAVLAARQKERALDMLGQVRAEYRVASDAIKEVGDSAVAAAFGGPKLPGPDKIKTLFNNMDKVEQRRVVNLLKENDVDTLNSLRGDFLKDIAKSARKATKGTTKSPFDVATFGKELLKLEDQGLLSQRQAKDALKAMANANVILNKVDGPIGNVPLLPKEIAINLMSRNPGFVARLLTQSMTGTGFEHFLFTKAGQEALRTLATTGAKSAKVTAAVGTLAGLSDPAEIDAVTDQTPDIANLGAF